MILATPQGVGTVWHSQRAYTHRKAANGQSFYFNWGAHDLSLVFTRLLIQAFVKTIFYKSVSRILFICRFCFFYWTLKLFRYLRLSRGFSSTIGTQQQSWLVLQMRAKPYVTSHASCGVGTACHLHRPSYPHRYKSVSFSFSYSCHP